MNNRFRGRVVAACRRNYVVKLALGSQVQCELKHRKLFPVVGDWVQIFLENKSQGKIESIFPRLNLLCRSNGKQTKILASNIDQLIMVVAVAPNFSKNLVDRVLVAAWNAGISPVVILNKIDIVQGLSESRELLMTISKLGVPIFEVSARNSFMVKKQLTRLLLRRTSLLLGQSGMGKSTLVNTLIPHAASPTRQYSKALNAGKHTTTSTNLYHLSDDSFIIDSPGFKNFGLTHLSRQEVLRGFPDFTPYLEHCGFHNCTHRHEPECGIILAVNSGKISEERYNLYRRIFEENKESKKNY